MKIIIASNNQGKVAEFKEIFSKFYIDILSLKDIGLDVEVVEDGLTFEENSLKKAREISKYTDNIVIADDSGLEVDALNGAPGVYSARFAGENATDLQKIEKLLKLLEGVPAEKRTARFVCVASMIFPDGRIFTGKGTVEGRLLDKSIGFKGFGYDSIFYYEPFGKTFSQMEMDEKNKVSHRIKAIEELKKNAEQELCKYK